MSDAEAGRLAHRLGQRGLVWRVLMEAGWGWGIVRSATCRRCGAVLLSYSGQVYAQREIEIEAYAEYALLQGLPLYHRRTGALVRDRWWREEYALRERME
jgi:hypothetical protein